MANVAPPSAPGMDEHHELSQPQQMAHVGTAVVSACTFAVRSAAGSHFAGTAYFSYFVNLVSHLIRLLATA
jgi:hypothetical protein